MGQGLQALKTQADELVASYGRFELATKMEAAIQELAELWSLSELELRILKPRKTLATSNLLNSAKNMAVSNAEQAGAVQGLASLAKEKGTAGIRTAARGAAKTGFAFAKRYPIACAAGAVVGAVAAGGVSVVTHRELRAFNERCYERRSTGQKPGAFTDERA